LTAETHDETARWRQSLAAQVKTSGHLCFRVAFGILRDSVAAEDACQQAYLKAWEMRGQLRDGAALRAWLLRVVVNESLQTLRRSKTERRVMENQVETRADEPSAARKLALRESILLAMKELPEATQAVVVMRLMDGRSGNEVKELLDCSASEVSRRLHDGIEALRELLADWSTSLGSKL